MKRWYGLALACCLCLPVSVSAQPSWLVETGTAIALVAHSADLSTTIRCLEAKTCTETNAVLLQHVESPKVFFTLKMGSALGSWAVKNRTKRDHPKLTMLFSVAESVTFFAIAYHNNQVHERALARQP